MDLHGKTVVLTGASGGIGAALATRLVARGAHVLAVARHPEPLNALARRHPAGAITPFAADLTEPADRAALLAHARTLLPSPSILVIAHARPAFGMFGAQHEAEFEALVRSNLLAPMQLIRCLLPVLQAHPQAAVLAVGSTFGSLAFPGFAAYSASKFGLRGLIEGLGREHADGPVRFQYIAPRATRTPFNTPAVDALNQTLGTRVDAPERVAEALVRAIERGTRRRQLGWPEGLFARINALLPGVVDRSLARQLPQIRHHAGGTPSNDYRENRHDPLPL
ncbi:SDR family oxidoreductase [Luteimonas terrae]|uniref:SDR family oxidoreductase n=1 Tax=Luteimonas terrae TaxID=1530191 RepID=A0A4R5U721_9GAMM|nr:SDR family oxidoreductase [Luteimonas terrae]TDK29591.1 SDR family oxidoreductase [Luteimonas terrae]